METGPLPSRSMGPWLGGENGRSDGLQDKDVESARGLPDRPFKSPPANSGWRIDYGGKTLSHVGQPSRGGSHKCPGLNIYSSHVLEGKEKQYQQQITL